MDFEQPCQDGELNTNKTQTQTSSTNPLNSSDQKEKSSSFQNTRIGNMDVYETMGTTSPQEKQTNDLSARQMVDADILWETDNSLYPRKQMRRKKWLSLNGPWKFSYDDLCEINYPQLVKNWDKTIQVPFAPETLASGINDQGFHSRCWYEKEIQLVCSGNNRLILHFGAVDYEAHVWLNNQYLGKHQGGHTPFEFEITGYLNADGKQTITVRADDDPHDLAKPRGKQDWQLNPHSIWYPRTTGIWQSVWIEEVPQIYMERIVWSAHLERYEIGCEAFIKGASDKNVQFRVRLSSNGKVLAKDTYEVIQGEVHRRIALSDPGIDDYRNELLWSPERPNLIQAYLELLVDGVVVDTVESYTALRSVGFLRDRFMLNGRPYYLRLVLDQGYWPETFMTPPSQSAIQKDIELVKASGFNGVRKHQKIEDPDFFYWADVMGLVVWEEMPSAYRFTNKSVERLMKEWTEVIERDSSHPSIVVWVPFNESWGVPDLVEKVTHQSCVMAMYHLTKTLDSSRPVVGNDGWESIATDIFGIHDYDANPQRILARYNADENVSEMMKRRRPGGRVLVVDGFPDEGKPIILTEFGGIACVERNRETADAWGYSVCATSDEFQRKYTDLLTTIHKIEMFTGFCYTQFTDTFQEANGLFKADRTPKFSLKAMFAATHGTRYVQEENTFGGTQLELE